VSVSSTLLRNNVRVGGNPAGQPMVFAHGFGCDQNMWRFVHPAFEADHKIVLFDHVGSGGSDLSAYDRGKYSRLDGYAADVLEICHELELADVILVGHSVASMIGVLAVIEEPSLFAKLILVSPSPGYINTGDYFGGFSREDIEGLLDSLDSNYLGWSSQMAPLIMGNLERPELAQELTDSFCRTDPDIARHFAHVTFTSDNRADLPKVKTRTLVLQCKEDSIAPQEVGRYVHDNISDSEFALLNATGHCPNLSAPEETVSAMKSFL
jgi:sigma-B regulation protein RsbQ